MIRYYTDIGDKQCRRNVARYAVLQGYDIAPYILGMSMRLFVGQVE